MFDAETHSHCLLLSKDFRSYLQQKLGEINPKALLFFIPKVRLKEKLDTRPGARKGNTSYEHSNECDIGYNRSDVDDLARGSNPAANAHEDQTPHEAQGGQQVRLDVSQFVDSCFKKEVIKCYFLSFPARLRRSFQSCSM